jgi:hypothetical protein
LKNIRQTDEKKLEATIFKHNRRKIQRKESSNLILDHKKIMVQANVYRSMQFERRIGLAHFGWGIRKQ